MFRDVRVQIPATTLFPRLAVTSRFLFILECFNKIKAREMLFYAPKTN